MRVLLSVALMATAAVGLSHRTLPPSAAPGSPVRLSPLLTHLQPVPPPLMTAFVFDERRLDPVSEPTSQQGRYRVLDVRGALGYNALRAHDL